MLPRKVSLDHEKCYRKVQWRLYEHASEKICLLDRVRDSDFWNMYYPTGKDILSYELLHDEKTIMKTTGSNLSVGGAIVGGALFGGIGAIIGGVTGTPQTETKEKVTSVMIKITVMDPKNPIHNT